MYRTGHLIVLDDSGVLFVLERVEGDRHVTIRSMRVNSTRSRVQFDLHLSYRVLLESDFYKGS